MKQIVCLFSLLFLMACSGSDSDKPAVSDALPDDSAQLRIAVMPTIDCLPVYLAAEHGFFEKAGINVGLYDYKAQMDCDTAIERGRVNAIVTDLVRAERMKERSKLDLQYVTSTEAAWQLVSMRNARINQLRQLDNKAIAMTRFSATHLLSEYVVEQAKVQPERVFFIQINNVNVRLNMLQNEILDALWLSEPQATDARNRQSKVLFDTRKSDFRFGVIAFRKSAATKKQVEAFTTAYNQACDSINRFGVQSYADILTRKCDATQQTIDSLPAQKFGHAAAPREADLKRAKDWLNKIKNDAHVEK